MAIYILDDLAGVDCKIYADFFISKGYKINKLATRNGMYYLERESDQSEIIIEYDGLRLFKKYEYIDDIIPYVAELRSQLRKIDERIKKYDDINIVALGLVSPSLYNQIIDNYRVRYRREKRGKRILKHGRTFIKLKYLGGYSVER